jgi:hypothetical protein
MDREVESARRGGEGVAISGLGVAPLRKPTNLGGIRREHIVIAELR